MAVIALNKSFHDKSNVIANGWKISRMKFFLIAFSAMFVYFWLPGGLFQALSCESFSLFSSLSTPRLRVHLCSPPHLDFNWITWIAPTNIHVMALFGQISGLGMNPLPTFDWNIFLGSTVLVIPFFSVFNQFVGTFISAFVILGVYYSNVWDSAYFPLNSNVSIALIIRSQKSRLVLTLVAALGVLANLRQRRFALQRVDDPDAGEAARPRQVPGLL